MELLKLKLDLSSSRNNQELKLETLMRQVDTHPETTELLNQELNVGLSQVR